MKQHYQGLGHIAVYTAGMDESIAFYEKIGGHLHRRAPACPPEQERELALVEFGGSESGYGSDAPDWADQDGDGVPANCQEYD